MALRAPTIAAVVPVRPFAESKRRLEFLLSPGERAALSRAMLADVLAAVAAGGFDQVIVVTSESDLSPSPGVEVLREGRAVGLNAAISLAASHLISRGVDAMLVVPADIPQLTGATLESCRAALAGERSAVLVPAAVDGGTNLLGLHPPAVIAPAFGPDSFTRHAAALRDADINPLVLQNSEARFDIDRPGDILRFLAMDTQTATQALLASLHVGDRLATAKSLEAQA
jgi:2-phospho-L-lactate guanylyltransferase